MPILLDLPQPNRQSPHHPRTQFRGGLSYHPDTIRRYRNPKRGRDHGRQRAVSASTKTDTSKVLDGGPAPDVVVNTDRQLHAESGIITHAGEDPDGELWCWPS